MTIRVLLVDDDQKKLARILSLLEQAGLGREDVSVAQTATDAKRLLAETKYDLLILDIALPSRPEDVPDRRGGIKLLEEVVEQDIYKRPLSVVGLTRYEDLQRECAEQFHSRLWTLEYYDTSTGWADRLKAKVKYILARANQKESLQYDKDICLITSLMNPELQAVRSLPWNWSQAASLDEVSYYYEGCFQSKRDSISVVASAAPRMGMVAAAVLTVKMIAQFRPRILIMTGICAGVEEMCSVGDVLVADPAWDWQMGKVTKAAFSVAPDQIDIPTDIAERFVQLGDDQKLWFDIHSSCPSEKPANLPRVKIGPVTSGSAVLADKRLLSEIRQQHRKLLGVEMELYGVYAAARDCAPPRPITFGLKSVSDYADSQKDDTYRAYSAYVASRAVAAFCERYASDFCAKA